MSTLFKLILITICINGAAIATEDLMETQATAGMHSLTQDVRGQLIPYYSAQEASRMARMNHVWRTTVNGLRLPADEEARAQLIRSELDRVLAPVMDPQQKPVLSVDFTEGFLPKVNRSRGGWEQFTRMLFADEQKLKRLTELNFQHFWSFMGRIKRIDATTRNAALQNVLTQKLDGRFYPFLLEVACASELPQDLQKRLPTPFVHRHFGGPGPFLTALTNAQLTTVLWTSGKWEIEEIWKRIYCPPIDQPSEISISPYLGGMPLRMFVEAAFLRTQDPDIIRLAALLVCGTQPELSRAFFQRLCPITFVESDYRSLWSVTQKLNLEDEAFNLYLQMVNQFQTGDSQVSLLRCHADDLVKRGKPDKAEGLYASCFRQTGKLEYLLRIYQAYKSANPETYGNKAVEWWQKLKSMPQYTEMAGRGYINLGLLDAGLGRQVVWYEPL